MHAPRSSPTQGNTSVITKKLDCQLSIFLSSSVQAAWKANLDVVLLKNMMLIFTKFLISHVPMISNTNWPWFIFREFIWRNAVSRSKTILSLMSFAYINTGHTACLGYVVCILMKKRWRRRYLLHRVCSGKQPSRKTKASCTHFEIRTQQDITDSENVKSVGFQTKVFIESGEI